MKTEREQIAEKLDISLEAVRVSFEQFEKNECVKHLQILRIENRINECRNKLESVTPEQLRFAQGEIAALRAAIGFLFTPAK